MEHSVNNNPDLALGKKVLEYCNHSHYLTAATHTGYDNRSGYCATHWPGYITVDLEGIFPVRQISFQLWDYTDSQNITPEKENHFDQIYAYRLLCSEDAETWDVIYDTANDNTKYKKGWQTFKLDKPVDARYIRIHAIHNKKNSGFHVVRLHAFQQRNTLYDSQDLFLCTGPFDQEIGDAYPMSYQLLDLSGRIQNITEEQNHTAIPDPSLKQRYHEVIDYLFEKSTELEAINGKIDEIRKLVTDPIGEEFNKFFRKYNQEQQTQIAVQILTILLWLSIQIKVFRLLELF